MAVGNRSVDAIVVGTGISGGWAAKELTEKGLKTLVLELPDTGSSTITIIRGAAASHDNGTDG